MNRLKSESFLLFRLKQELFAINVHKVLEIIETGEENKITPLPKAPRYISGVVNFRGDVVPVINTRLKFDLDNYRVNEKFVIIILKLIINNEPHIIGAKSDKVVDVIEISESEIKSVPAVGKGLNAEFIQGVIYRDNQSVMLINMETVITNNEIISLKEKEILTEI